MLLVDDFRRLKWVFFLHQKSESFPSFIKWLALVHNDSKQTLKTLCVEKGKEFTSNAMVEFFSQRGIQQEFANIGTPSENGVVEQKNWIVIEMARTMMAH